MKMLDEGFLPGFYSKLVAEYAVKNLDSLADTVTKFGEPTAIGTLKAVPNRQHPNGPIGDNAHAAIDAFTQGTTIPSFDTVTAAHMFESYQGFVDLYRPKVLRSEFTVWSYRHGYAGTGDLLWDLPGLGLGVVDVKTGMRIWPKVGMQTAALSEAEIVLDRDGTEQPMPDVDWQGVLHVRPKSVKLYVIQRIDENFSAFLACLELFTWTRNAKDSVLKNYPDMQWPPKPLPKIGEPLPPRSWPHTELEPAPEWTLS
jgi:hypothetical protein